MWHRPGGHAGRRAALGQARLRVSRLRVVGEEQQLPALALVQNREQRPVSHAPHSGLRAGAAVHHQADQDEHLVHPNGQQQAFSASQSARQHWRRHGLPLSAHLLLRE